MYSRLLTLYVEGLGIDINDQASAIRHTLDVEKHTLECAVPSSTRFVQHSTYKQDVTKQLLQ